MDVKQKTIKMTSFGPIFVYRMYLFFPYWVQKQGSCKGIPMGVEIQHIAIIVYADVVIDTQWGDLI